MENKLTEIFEEIDKLDDHSDNVCINCGASLGDDYATHCKICGYDMDSTFTCPYIVSASVPLNNNEQELNFCSLNRKLCKVKGFDFEICSVFRSLDLINKYD